MGLSNKEQADNKFNSRILIKNIIIPLTLLLVMLVGGLFWAATTIQAESISLGGDSLVYDQEKGLVTITTNVTGQYRIINFFADEILIKLEGYEEEMDEEEPDKELVEDPEDPEDPEKTEEAPEEEAPEEEVPEEEEPEEDPEPEVDPEEDPGVSMPTGMGDPLGSPQEILMEPGAFTGCDLDRLHNYFQASKIEIYPGEYLIAYHVVFYELDGRLPLFYWPILYINLDDDRPNWEFEYGYSSTRGWFGLLTRNHRWLFGLAGQLYFDYYQHTGPAFGFRQQYVDSDSHEGEIYYYRQDNQDDVPGLFDWEAALHHELDWQDWSGNLDVEYEDYDDYFELVGEADLENETDEYLAYFSGDYELDYYRLEEDEDRSLQETVLSAGYDRDFSFDFWQFQDLNVYLDYELELTDYLTYEEDDLEVSELNLGLAKSFANNLDLDFDFYREVEQEPEETPFIENQGELQGRYSIGNLNLGAGYEYTTQEEGEEEYFQDLRSAEADYSWGDGWGTEFAYETGRLQEPGLEEVERWAGLAALSLTQRPWTYELVLERDAPDFPDPPDPDDDEDEEDEDEGVAFTRLPEANVYYEPAGPFDYQLQAGRYYEDETGTEGLRGAGIVNFSERWQPHPLFDLRSSQTLRGNVYRAERGDDLATMEANGEAPYYLNLTSELDLRNQLTDHLSLRHRYDFGDYRGATPFEFDVLEEENEITNELTYRRDWLEFDLDSGYDLLDEEYLALAGVLTLIPHPNLELEFESEYDLNERLFSEDLDFTTSYVSDNWDLGLTTSYDLEEREFSEVLTLESDYSGDRLSALTSLDYNMNERKLEILENDLEYEIPGDEGLYFKNVIEYDFDEPEERLQKATLELHKRLHCRELHFSYDHSSREFMVTYKLNLFRGRGVGLGRDEEGMLFDFGAEDVD